jgi:alpha-tubulin suppressor-like RCC1 family protein
MTGIRAGAQHSCWSNASAFQCWGRNDQGQLGLGSAGPDVLSPTTVTGGTPLSFSLGEAHTCFIAATNQLFCFGANSSGQLGIGAISTPVLTPTQEATGSSSWLLVDAGGSHTCAIGRGTLYCWGSNAAGQLGLGGTMDVSTPMLVGGDRSWTVISAGRSHTCGLQGAGQLWCWGDNTQGQLGDGTSTPRDLPTRIGPDSDWLEVAAGATHTCGIRPDGVYCWGNNASGQLGIAGPSLTRPTRVCAF